MKIGVSVYSYAEYLENGEMTINDVIEYASDIGYAGIEFADFVMPYQGDRLGFAQDLKNLCDEKGVVSCGYVALSDFFKDDLDTELIRLKEEIDICEALGAPSVCLVFMNDFNTDCFTIEQCIDRAVNGIRMLADYAKEKGIVLTTENVGRIFLDSYRLEQLLGKVDHENFRILADTGNFSDGDEDSALAMGRIVHLTAQVHFKDYHIKSGEEFYPGEGWYVTRGGCYIRGAIVGHGNIPMMKCLKVLEESGYQGWLVVEFDGIEEPKQATLACLKNIKRMMKALEFFRWSDNY